MDYTNLKEKMEKAINSYNERLSEIRAGRANPAILNKVKIDYYGTPTPINQVAGVSVPEARMIVIQPWDISVLKEIENDYDFILVNFANPDMVGHTGNLEAAIKAVETIDASVGKVVEAVNAQNGVLMITADHGNCEQMIDYKTGEPHTAHTTNPVPIILVGMDNAKLREGKLADLTPTMLDIMGLKKPEEMTGESIIVEK